MEFYFESLEVGMYKKSQGKLMSVVTKIFLIRQTVFFFTGLGFSQQMSSIFLKDRNCL